MHDDTATPRQPVNVAHREDIGSRRKSSVPMCMSHARDQTTHNMAGLGLRDTMNVMEDNDTIVVIDRPL